MNQTIKIIFGFFLLILAFNFSSCLRDENVEEYVELSKKEPTTYEELFLVFWDTMNANYNYHSEDNSDWDNIHTKYLPKFAKLTSFGEKEVNNFDFAVKEANLAFKYFAEIAKNVLDKHFNFSIFISLPHKISDSNPASEFAVFFSGMKYSYSEKDGYKLLKNDKRNPHFKGYVLIENARKLVDEDHEYSFMGYRHETVSSSVICGPLKTDPSITYLKFNKFTLSYKTISLDEIPFLNDYHKIELSKAYKALEDVGYDPSTVKVLVEDYNDTVEKSYNQIKNSKAYSDLIEGKKQFLKNEDISLIVKNMGTYYSWIAKLSDLEGDFLILTSDIANLSYAANINQKVRKALFYLYQELIDKNNKMLIKSGIRVVIAKDGAKEFSDFFISEVLKELIFTSHSILTSADFYHRIYNPLTNGKIKKIIIDLRGNGGGLVSDTHQFIERFVTKRTTWGFQRTKEGNDRFDYSPWIKNFSKPHQYAIKNNIPIVVLTDENSFSMAEICTMILRSQGSHVTVVGDNTGGATAGLGGNEDYNGGYIGGYYAINSSFSIYLPLMAFKDADGNVIEGKGVAPDIKLIPTEDQVNNNNDIVLKKAIELLN